MSTTISKSTKFGVIAKCTGLTSSIIAWLVARVNIFKEDGIELSNHLPVLGDHAIIDMPSGTSCSNWSINNTSANIIIDQYHLLPNHIKRHLQFMKYLLHQQDMVKFKIIAEQDTYIRTTTFKKVCRLMDLNAAIVAWLIDRSIIQHYSDELENTLPYIGSYIHFVKPNKFDYGSWFIPTDEVIVLLNRYKDISQYDKDHVRSIKIRSSGKPIEHTIIRKFLSQYENRICTFRATIKQYDKSGLQYDKPARVCLHDVWLLDELSEQYVFCTTHLWLEIPNNHIVTFANLCEGKHIQFTGTVYAYNKYREQVDKIIHNTKYGVKFTNDSIYDISNDTFLQMRELLNPRATEQMYIPISNEHALFV